MDLLNRSRVQEAFERQVVADAPQQIERKVGELIDWMIDADLRHWQGVTAHLAKRRQQYAGTADRQSRHRALPLRSPPHDRLGRPRGADGGRRLRSAEGSERARRWRAKRRRDGCCGGRRRRGPRRHRDDCRVDRCRRRHRARHGVGARRDRVLRDSCQTQEGQGRDAEEDRARCASASAMRCGRSSRKRSRGRPSASAPALRPTAASSGPRERSSNRRRTSLRRLLRSSTSLRGRIESTA